MTFYPEYYQRHKVHGRKHTGNYINADQVHVCRDFEFLLRWKTSRHSGREAAGPRYRNATAKILDFNEP
ncbi:hypothetical protein COCMIDRAFT_38104 [Bipolaris oryzae ATCC 44560]|uniref:Uncharacterized protein n=1 Tax=Bipolaris oryzae ATCC 44560 TaxID=930090 RepID=W6YX55_COCMI|nr:uncharacterized protein COCMIDRAFT_38104 [Bipolaris oryzae ATCC 44560]EUC43977.1 hypothetical protein COCMIDRAFT_38104 [Bipolaris oryzae ATCC 44560]